LLNMDAYSSHISAGRRLPFACRLPAVCLPFACGF